MWVVPFSDWYSEAMEVALGDFELDASPTVDPSFFAFHEESFRIATKHVVKWLNFNPECRRKELGMARAFKVFVTGGGHTST